MATNSASNSLVYRQENYTTAAAASVATKTFSLDSGTGPAQYLLISNTSSSNDALLSFDGTNYITLFHGRALEIFPAKLYSYKVKDAVDNSHATLETLYGVEK